MNEKANKRGATCHRLRHGKKSLKERPPVFWGWKMEGKKQLLCTLTTAEGGLWGGIHTRRHALSTDDTHGNSHRCDRESTLCLSVYTSPINTPTSDSMICAQTPKCTSSPPVQMSFFSLHGRKRKQKRTEQRKQSAQSRVTEGN